MKIVKTYSEKDYEGEFNLLKMERRIIVRDLSTAQNIKEASKILKFSDRGLYIKMAAHQIKREEWKRKTN